MQRRDLLKTTAAGGLLSALAGLLPVPVAVAGEVKGSDSALALSELLATLAELDANFSLPQWHLRTPRDHAEARRVLLHTLTHGLQTWLEADPARPFFTSFIGPHKKVLGDNPDALYHSAVIDGSHRYRIYGNLAGATYTSFTIELGAGSESSGLGSTLNDTQFEADAEGNYEIIVSAEKAAGNWMPLSGGAASITTRHYYERPQSIGRDRLHRIPIAIENMDDAGPRAAPGDAAIAVGIRRVGEFIRRNVIRFDSSTSPAWVSRLPNQFPRPGRDDSNRNIDYAAVDNVYSMAPFVLKPDQALVMSGRFPPARFANVMLWNQFMQTFDYETRQVSLNRRQVELEADGSFRIVIAHRDPGTPNWLDTEGRGFGMVFWRFLLPEEAIEPIETAVITL